MYRVFFPFDTSGLDDGAEIVSARLYFYSQFGINNGTDNNDFITVVQTTQESNTSLRPFDHEDCGLIDNPIGVRKIKIN